MQLLTILAWIAFIYCAGGMLAVLVVCMAGNQTCSNDTDDSKDSRRLLQVFAAWPVVAGIMLIVATTVMAQKLRVRPSA